MYLPQDRPFPFFLPLPASCLPCHLHTDFVHHLPPGYCLPTGLCTGHHCTRFFCTEHCLLYCLPAAFCHPFLTFYGLVPFRTYILHCYSITAIYRSLLFHCGSFVGGSFLVWFWLLALVGFTTTAHRLPLLPHASAGSFTFRFLRFRYRAAYIDIRRCACVTANARLYRTAGEHFSSFAAGRTEPHYLR